VNGFWNFSDGVVYFVVHFILTLRYPRKLFIRGQDLYLHFL